MLKNNISYFLRGQQEGKNYRNSFISKKPRDSLWFTTEIPVGKNEMKYCESYVNGLLLEIEGDDARATYNVFHSRGAYMHKNHCYCDVKITIPSLQKSTEHNE